MGEARGLTYGLAMGAGLMFVLDPRQGGARRALVRDKSARALHDVEHAARIGAKDLGHRGEGLVARFFGADHEPVSEVTLEERVRARLGHVCRHPQAVTVRARGRGEIELKGPVESDEAERVLSAIARVRGVRAIDDDLSRVERLPGGPGPRAGSRADALKQLWNPTTRLALGVASLGVALSGLLRARPLSFALGAASVLGLARNMVARGGSRSAGRQLAAVGAVGPGGEPVTGLREAYGSESAWNPPNALDPDREAPASGDAVDR
jgi:hypothetical protein